jgi:hypothetical protein
MVLAKLRLPRLVATKDIPTVSSSLEGKKASTIDMPVTVLNTVSIWLMYLCSLAVYMGSGEHTDHLAHWDFLLQESPFSNMGAR